jgi:branched-chain amino acid transport system substrate-binding protein
MTASRWRRSAGALLVAGLVLAACGSDDDGGDDGSTDSAAPVATDAPDATEAPDGTDAPADTSGETETTEGDDAGGGEELALEGQVEIAEGTVLDLDECPGDWDALQGVDGDEIRIGQSLPQSGPLASFGPIGEGMQMWFDYVNETDPIDGKTLVLVTKDDAYEAGRGVANVEEMLDTEDIFAFAHIIGTPINAAVRPITDEACVPQLFNSTGFPDWGDPANWPWTIGNILDYSTETNIWCDAIVEEYGAGATVAALYTNNDFGKTYQNTLQGCDVEIVEEQLHDPAAADITNELTTVIASDADVFVAGVTGAFCPQAIAAVASSQWRPEFYMSYTCNNLASFIEPVHDAAATLAADGVAVQMTISNKVCGDPRWDDDESTQLTIQVLADYGDVTCADGSYSTGILFGQLVESVLRDAAARPGGLNRVNLMAAVWNADFTNGNLIGGTLQTDGVNDAYFTEAAQIQEIVENDSGALTFQEVGDLIDLEGEGGSFGS